MKNNMYEVAVALAPKQSQLIDYLVEDAVIVKEIPFQAATHGIKNVFERVKDVTGPTLVDLDAPLPLVTALTELGETPLFKIGGKLEIGKDKAEAMHGKEEYLRNRLPAILKLAGASLDKAIYYDVMLKRAMEMKRVKSCTTSVTDTSEKKYYSMVAIRWSAGENCGLYNNNRTNGSAEGSFFTMDNLWGGQLGTLSGGETGWAIDVTSMIGLQIENPKYIMGFVNITEDNLPSYADLIGIANGVRGNGANARIYASPELADILASKYSRAAGDNSFSSLVTVDTDGNVRIKGIPVVGDYNILAGTEAGILTSTLAA